MPLPQGEADLRQRQLGIVLADGLYLSREDFSGGKESFCYRLCEGDAMERIFACDIYSQPSCAQSGPTSPNA